MCCAAEMQLPSFYQSENPLYRSFGARGFLFAFLLVCLCELHRIRIVQAEMGLAGSRTSFSFPPNRKPSFLSVIFCMHHLVCPLVHPILPVTAFGWQFLYRGCVFVVTVFLFPCFSRGENVKHTKGKCMYTFYIMRFFEKTHISVYDGSLKGLCKMIELILQKKLEPNRLQEILERTNVSRLGLQYIKKIEMKYC